MNLSQLLDQWKHTPSFMENVTTWRTIPAKEAVYADPPAALSPILTDTLRKRGVHRLYSHQRDAVELALAGKDVCVVTPTASGKTLCYNLPVMDAILRDHDARALYLFPTKALSADQVAELYEFVQAADADIKAFTYDGDTPAAARSKVRSAGHIVVTNPDMLHSGILPNHTKWVKLFENLRYIVVDEIHAYRGIFGSHLANVLRRLERICAFYGSRPVYICCSATIANPGELAQTLTGRPLALVDKSGAPSAEKHMIFFNPPVVNKQLGIRRGSLVAARDIASTLVRNDIQTIAFARSRLAVEVLATYLKRLVTDQLGGADKVRAYRGGYLPGLRREIERGLRGGDITAVVSTNALELGIDIGRLEACVLCGYPGTIASTLQQAGRAGRRQGASATILVASSSPLDQYIVAHPEYFFEQSPEMALIHPNNLYIMMTHLKCAAYELPFAQEETYAGLDSTADMLTYLAEEGIVRNAGGKYHWMAEEFPASGMSLRTANDENFLIIDISEPSHHRVIGEMDRFTVPMLLHEQAVYLHEGKQYQVEKLDFDDHKAYIRAVDVDYYTDADLNTSLRVLDVFDQDEHRAKGEVLVSSIVTMFKKMKFDTHENLGWGRVNLPELEMHTTAAWMTAPPAVMEGYSKETAQAAMVGVSNILRGIAPLYLMCSAFDLSVHYHVRDPFTDLPTIYFHDSVPGGIGLSDKIYDLIPVLLERAKEAVSSCPCEDGCPSCIGPAGEGVKQASLAILGRLTQ